MELKLYTRYHVCESVVCNEEPLYI